MNILNVIVCEQCELIWNMWKSFNYDEVCEQYECIRSRFKKCENSSQSIGEQLSLQVWFSICASMVTTFKIREKVWTIWRLM